MNKLDNTYKKQDGDIFPASMWNNTVDKINEIIDNLCDCDHNVFKDMKDLVDWCKKNNKGPWENNDNSGAGSDDKELENDGTLKNNRIYTINSNLYSEELNDIFKPSFLRTTNLNNLLFTVKDNKIYTLVYTPSTAPGAAYGGDITDLDTVAIFPNLNCVGKIAGVNECIYIDNNREYNISRNDVLNMYTQFANKVYNYLVSIGYNDYANGGYEIVAGNSTGAYTDLKLGITDTYDIDLYKINVEDILHVK